MKKIISISLVFIFVCMMCSAAVCYRRRRGAGLALITEFQMYMNDNAADTVIAEVVNSNDGVLIGGDNTSVKAGAGKINNAITLNGTDDSIDCSASATVLQDNGAGAIAFWIKRGDFDAVGAQTDYIWAISDAATNDTHIYFRFYFDDSPDRQWLQCSARVDDVVPWDFRYEGLDFANVYEGKWVHMIFSHNVVQPEVYVNNVLQTVDVWAVTTDKTVWFQDVMVGAVNDAEALEIGSLYTAGARTGFGEFTVDDFRILSEAPNADQRAFLYNSGNGTENLSG